uniref:Uncharacterized protein n=1 Tax=Callorhinchus milii TaxID=7868 RepID=A0A4W3H634_CALMI
MEDFLVVCKQLHRQLLAGERPSISSQDLAKFLNLDVYMTDLSDLSTDFHLSTDQRNWIHDTQPSTPPFMPPLPEDSHGKQPHEPAVSVNDSKNEILLFQITLIQMINSKVNSQTLEEDIRETYTKAIRILLEDTEIISKLILLFKHSNQLLSHVAMKCVSSLIIFQLFTTDLSSDIWFKTCIQTLSEDPRNTQSAKCLEIVAAVLKGVLEGKFPNKTEDLNVQLQTCIHQLMMFIRTHLKSPAHSKRLIHSCAWVSLVFLEQDDDMVEAARALLNIYIHSVRFFDAYHGERGVNSLNAHESCFNPHCIFLLLLNNLTFDHCVLLDFLISAETCFLEYFVRYLRLLREEWQCFLCICRQFDEAELICPAVANEDSKHSDGEKQERTIAGTEGSKGYPWEHVPQAVLNLSACHILTPEEEQRKDKDTADSSKCGILINSSKFCLGGQSQGLVDYANSEDSDSESVEVPEFNIYSQEANPINNSKITKLASVNTIKDSEKNNCNLDTRDPGNLSLDYCDEKDTNMCASSGTVFNKSVTCLIELKKTIARLQGRNLFPYNAIALLRLLFQIETLSATTLHE